MKPYDCGRGDQLFEVRKDADGRSYVAVRCEHPDLRMTPFDWALGGLFVLCLLFGIWFGSRKVAP